MLDVGCFLNSSESNRRCQGREKFNTMETAGHDEKGRSKNPWPY